MSALITVSKGLIMSPYSEPYWSTHSSQFRIVVLSLTALCDAYSTQLELDYYVL
jgi:hypothetical protein